MGMIINNCQNMNIEIPLCKGGMLGLKGDTDYFKDPHWAKPLTAKGGLIGLQGDVDFLKDTFDE